MRDQSEMSWRGFRVGLVLAGLAAGLGAGCGGGGASGPPPDVAVEVVLQKPALESVEGVLTAVGTIEPNERVELKPKTSGAVETVQYVEGQRVTVGARLMELDSRKEKASLLQAEAEEQLARSNVARARTLAGTKAISQQELDQLESQVAVRAAFRQLEQERLDERVLLAPIAGILGLRLVSPGQYLAVGTSVGVLVDDSRVKVQFRIPERDLGRIRVGQEGRLRVASHGDRLFQGQVELVDPEVDPSTRTVMIRLVAKNPEFILRPGMFARVELVTGRRDNALVIPEGAIVPSMDRFSVFVSDNGRAVSRPVVLGVRLPGKVEVVGGLTASSEVVVNGTQKLVEGMKVTSPAPTPAALAPSASPTQR